MQIENCVDSVQFLREKKVFSYPDWHAFACAPNLPEACDLSKRVSQILRHQGPLVVNGGACMRASVKRSGLGLLASHYPYQTVEKDGVWPDSSSQRNPKAFAVRRITLRSSDQLQTQGSKTFSETQQERFRESDAEDCAALRD